jgi:hypothetical protein
VARALPTGWTDYDRGPRADAEERTRSAHRAIEIREKRRRVLSSLPARITLALQPTSSVSAPIAMHAIGKRTRRTPRSARRRWSWAWRITTYRIRVTCAAGTGWLTHCVISVRVKTATALLLAEVRRRAWWSRRSLLSAGAADLAVLAACARVPADELERSVWRVLARPGSWQACAGSSAGSGPDFLPALNRQRDNDQPGRAPSADARRAGRARRHPGTQRVVGSGRGVARGHRAGGTLAGR